MGSVIAITALMIAGFIVVGWMLYRTVKFNKSLGEISANKAGKGPGRRGLSLWSLIVSRPTTPRDQMLRTEALASLGPLLLVFFCFTLVIMLLVSLTT